MKARKFLIVALALSMATVACSQNNAKLPDGTSAKDLLPSKAQVDSVSYLLGINFGSFLKSYNFGEDLNYAEMKKGILDFLGAEGDQTDTNFVKQFKVNPELMNDVFNSFLDKRAEYTTALASAKEKEFFDSNAQKDGIKTTESGLQYKIVEPGSEVKPGPQDTVLVRGWQGRPLHPFRAWLRQPWKRQHRAQLHPRIRRGACEGSPLCGPEDRP